MLNSVCGNYHHYCGLLSQSQNYWLDFVRPSVSKTLIKGQQQSQNRDHTSWRKFKDQQTGKQRFLIGRHYPQFVIKCSVSWSGGVRVNKAQTDKSIIAKSTNFKQALLMTFRREPTMYYSIDYFFAFDYKGEKIGVFWQSWLINTISWLPPRCDSVEFTSSSVALVLLCI